MPQTLPTHRPPPSTVTYHIPTTPSFPCITTILLPPSSTWTSNTHFHASHTEFLHLVSGAIFLSIDGHTAILSAAKGNSGVVRIPRYARHNWGRAEYWLGTCAGKNGEGVDGDGPEDVDDEVVVREWMEPGGVGKAVFFWNLNGVVNGVDVGWRQRVGRYMLGKWWVEFELFVIFAEFDNWPVFEGVGRWMGGGRVQRGVEYGVAFGVLGVARVGGWVVGVKAVEERRTPRALWDVYRRKGG